ncbi:MAG: AEC family transporter [Clostridia bacterium]|nr:AEC family transporter [Clostridia bacterium]
MGIVLNKLLILYIFLLVGWFMGKRKPTLVSGTGLLSALLVNLFLPAKVFSIFAEGFTVAYIREKYVLLLGGTVMLLAVVGISRLVAPRLTSVPFEQKVYRYSLTLSNYAYMGYVLMESLFGGGALTDLILFCIPFALYTYTFGFWMLTGAERSAGRLLNPLTVSLVLGIVFGLTGATLPGVIDSALNMASACVGPIGMLLTGLVLSAYSLKEVFFNKKAYPVVALRLLVLPLVTFLICRFLLPRTLLLPALFVACMPCGLNTVIFPKFVGEDTLPGARLALLSHLFSCITVPFWISLI